MSKVSNKSLKRAGGGRTNLDTLDTGDTLDTLGYTHLIQQEERDAGVRGDQRYKI
jgi:hypothetical protein